MARPPKYTREDEKPVSVTLRIPRALYDQAQHVVTMRRTTFTALMVEGLQMRLDTPTDPRDIVATQDMTVMQELRQMIAAEVQAALAAQHLQAPERTPARQRADKSKTQHYGNATPVQVYAPEPGHGVITAPARTRPAPGQHKLTPLQVAEMRGKRSAGIPMKALMEEYGISRATAHRYLHGARK